MPRSIPVRCSTSVRPPTRATSGAEPDAPARHRRSGRPRSSSARPLATAHAAALGNIEMPSFLQSVSRWPFTTQPTSVTSPPADGAGGGHLDDALRPRRDLLRRDGAQSCRHGPHGSLGAPRQPRATSWPRFGESGRVMRLRRARRNSVAPPLVICSAHPARVRLAPASLWFPLACVLPCEDGTQREGEHHEQCNRRQGEGSRQGSSRRADRATRELEDEGKLDQAAGKVKEKASKIVDKVRDAVTRH